MPEFIVDYWDGGPAEYVDIDWSEFSLSTVIAFAASGDTTAQTWLAAEAARVNLPDGAHVEPSEQHPAEQVRADPAHPAVSASGRVTFDWEEDAHPRDASGRFGSGDGEPAVDRAARVETQIADAIAAGRDTASLHDGPVTGVSGLWTKERDAMHREIVQKVLDEHAHVPREREAVMTGGLPGSGKSSVLADPQAGISPDRYMTIDADRMKDELYARDGVDRSDPLLDGVKQQELASIVHAESSHLCDMLREAATSAGVNVALDRTMNKAEPVTVAIDRLREQGYSVRGIFVDVKPETSLARAASRYEKGNATSQGGRLVPQSFIRSMADPEHGSTARATWESVKSSFDGGWQLWNNDGDAPTLTDEHV